MTNIFHKVGILLNRAIIMLIVSIRLFRVLKKFGKICIIHDTCAQLHLLDLRLTMNIAIGAYDDVI